MGIKKGYLRILALLLFTVGNSVFAEDIEDTQVIDELNKSEAIQLDEGFELQSFGSCEDFETVMGDYMKSYWKNNQSRYYRGGPILYMEDDMVMESVADVEESADSSLQSKAVGGAVASDYSETNTQVQGVDESDIVKTDGKYIYYYNQEQTSVYIIEAFPVSEKKVIKKIQLPKNMYSPVLYLGEDRLVIVAGGYSDYNYAAKGYWVNRSSKTYAIVFDTTDVKKPKLLKLYVTDGNMTNSRKIGRYVYLISTNYFNIPYYRFTDESEIEFDAKDLIPRNMDISKTSVTTKQNLTVKGKKFPYHVSGGLVAPCNEIEYILPDEETLKKYDISPSYSIISVIDTLNTGNEVETKVIAGNTSEIYMSQTGLYMTDYIYTTNDFRCGPNMRCLLPYYSRGENTLIHKFDVSGLQINYADSTIIPGNPLTQYSMDESGGYFRIITKKWSPEMETGLYVLDHNLELVGSLTGLGKTEDFKSSRFMGDKLYLVTFKQVDPFFVIDLADVENPKVLGELKIPGYSTYLHPYDATHIIGLGYDTFENEWGGTQNGGMKLDLYKVHYDRQCGDTDLTTEEQKKCDTGDYTGIIIEQVATKTFGDAGSYSEALNNPRMFMWNANKQLLFLPATIYHNYSQTDYRRKDFFNGMLAIQIDPSTGISEQFRVTHIDMVGIEAKRLETCEKYTVQSTKDCHTLIGGGEYCAPSSGYRYVPSYCYADSDISEYIAANSWNFRESFIERAVWLDDVVYGLSNAQMSSHNMNTGVSLGNLLLK